MAAAVALAAAIGEARGARIVPAGAPPGARVVAPAAAGAAGRRPLRRAARARLHHVHPHLRRLGAGRRQRRARRSGARPRDRARLRRRPAAARRRARARRRHGGGAACTPRWPSGRGSCARCAPSTPWRWRRARSRWSPDGRAAGHQRERPERRRRADRLARGGQPGVLVRDGQQTPPGRRAPGARPGPARRDHRLDDRGAVDVAATASARASRRPAPTPSPSRTSWVAWRAREGDGDVIYAAPLGAGEPPREVMRARRARPPRARRAAASRST